MAGESGLFRSIGSYLDKESQGKRIKQDLLQEAQNRNDTFSLQRINKMSNVDAFDNRDVYTEGWKAKDTMISHAKKINDTNYLDFINSMSMQQAIQQRDDYLKKTPRDILISRIAGGETRPLTPEQQRLADVEEQKKEKVLTEILPKMTLEEKKKYVGAHIPPVAGSEKELNIKLKLKTEKLNASLRRGWSVPTMEGEKSKIVKTTSQFDRNILDNNLDPDNPDFAQTRKIYQDLDNVNRKILKKDPNDKTDYRKLGLEFLREKYPNLKFISTIWGIPIEISK